MSSKNKSNQFLEKIVQQKIIEIKNLKERYPTNYLQVFSDSTNFSDLKQIQTRFLSKKNKLSLIAEVKKKSPSKGIIRADFDPVKIAKEFESKKASAISVLTDNQFFGGKLEFLESVKLNTSLPVLRKDFILDKIQIIEAKQNSADIILLIAKILPNQNLQDLILFALQLDLQILLEFHNLEEINRFKQILDFLQSKYPTINLQEKVLLGINNRDLDTFEVDFNTCLNLKKVLPEGFLTVAESAISEVFELEILEKSGFNFVLIGEGLAKNKDLLNFFA
jgi:indole-3-glycerol phosphate synthase